MASKVVQHGANKPLRISLPDCYWDVLFAMAQLEGREVEDLAIEIPVSFSTSDLQKQNPSHFQPNTKARRCH
jgi:hypothetical protein